MARVDIRPMPLLESGMSSGDIPPDALFNEEECSTPAAVIAPSTPAQRRPLYLAQHTLAEVSSSCPSCAICLWSDAVGGVQPVRVLICRACTHMPCVR